MIFDILDRARALGGAVLLSLGSQACTAIDNEIPSEAVDSAEEELFIGPAGKRANYFKCADEYGLCALSTDKYAAFGVTGSWVFKPTVGSFDCTVGFFGADPAPGRIKRCYFANLGNRIPQNSGTSWNANVAYGVDGAFHFREMNGSFTCNDATFGDPAPGLVKDCYIVNNWYIRVAREEDEITVSNQSVVYGTGANYIHKVDLNGRFRCNNATFGYDPAPGLVKYCHVFNVRYLASEGQTLPGGTAGAYYGSGLNGSFLSRSGVGGRTCSNGTFSADPDPGFPKFCWSQ